jgi:hypothetical protein
VPYHDDDGGGSSPAKVAPKPPPKPKKRLSTTGDSIKLDDPAESGGGQAAYEDEGEDGTEV